MIRPLLKYACLVWHSSLTVAQTKALESLGIIYEEDDYTMSLIQELDTLESRHEELTKRFFKRSVLPDTSCLHYLLPDKRDVSVTGRLRHARMFEPPKSRTVKFRNSLILYCLDRYV